MPIPAMTQPLLLLESGRSVADLLGASGKDGGIPDSAYERLVMDVIRGNQTLFMRGDEVEAAWGWTDPIIEGWTKRGEAPKPYASHSEGPDASEQMMARDHRKWRKVEP